MRGIEGHHPAVRVFALSLALISFAAGSARSQQTIVNVPSDSLTPKSQQFFLHETALVPRKPGDRFQTTNFYTYGLTDHTELAATLYSVNNAGSPNMALGLGFKSVYPTFRELLPDLEGKFTIGSMLPISTTPNRQGVGTFSYSSLAFNIPNTDLRLLGGAAFGSRNLYGKDAVDPIMGLEYPMSENLSFTGEWFGGNHNFSGLIPGVTYHKQALILVAGYKIPNDFDPKGYGVVLEAGFFFGGRKPNALEMETKRAAPENHYGTRRPRDQRRFKLLPGFGRGLHRAGGHGED